MKEILEGHGYGGSRTGSPKMIIKLAFSAGMVEDEPGWMELLDMRKEISRSYNEEVAKSIIEKTKSRYLALFEALEKELRENWL